MSQAHVSWYHLMVTR